MFKQITAAVMLFAVIGSAQTAPDAANIRLSPRLLNYQGFLTDTLGNPININSLSMNLTIFDQEAGGSQLWTESQSPTVENGIFHVLLGSETPIPDSVFTKSPNRWLEIQVGLTALTPRTRIVSAAYAVTSTYADTAQYVKNGASDNDWTRSGGKVYTANLTDSVGVRTSSPRYALDVDGAFCAGTNNTANGTYGGILSGYNNQAGTSPADTAAAVAGGWSNQALKYSFVGGGRYNTASGLQSTVAGGYSNIANNTAAAAGGGMNNYASGILSVAAGGYGNVASGYSSAVGGGYENLAAGDYAAVAGGVYDTASGSYSSVAGGYVNKAGGNYSAVAGGIYNTAAGTYSTVTGGWFNVGSGDESFIGGGYRNRANAQYATVSGGYACVAGGDYSTIAGGVADTSMARYGAVLGGYRNVAGDAAEDTAAVVAGGYNNYAIDRFAAVLGGQYDTAAAAWSTVGGGYTNKAGGVNSTVGGGLYNTASGMNSTVAGGWFNVGSGAESFIGGGYRNRAVGDYSAIGGGHADTASGYCSTAPGGSSNKAAGDYSFAAGRRAKANYQGCFVWGDATDADLNTTSADNQWVARSSGGFYLYTNSGLSSGVYLNPGDNSWSSVSDRNMKENFRAVDGEGILLKLESMPISTWNYKSQDPSIRHIGPMAQDFAGFGVGKDDKRITTVDADGIAFAAIQELAKQVRELKAENERLQERIEKLESE